MDVTPSEETYQLLRQHVIEDDDDWVKRFLSYKPKENMLMRLFDELIHTDNDAFTAVELHLHELFRLQHVCPEPKSVLIAAIHEGQNGAVKTILERFTLNYDDYILAGNAAVSRHNVDIVDMLTSAIPSDIHSPSIIGIYLTTAFRTKAFDIANNLYDRFAAEGQLSKNHYGHILNASIINAQFSFIEKIMIDNAENIDRDYLHDAFKNIKTFEKKVPELVAKFTRTILPYATDISSDGIDLIQITYPDKIRSLFSLPEHSRTTLLNVLTGMACEEHNITPIDLLPDAPDWLKPAILDQIT